MPRPATSEPHTTTNRRRDRSPHSRLPVLLAGALLLGLASCAAPGEPEVPRPRIPEAIQDLAAAQLGDQVVLTWTPAALETSGARLEQPPKYEIYRAFAKDAASAPQVFARTAALVLTLPANLADTFLEAGRIRFPDPLGRELAAEHAAEFAVYAVKSLNPKGQSAGFSPLVSVRIYPSIPPPRALRAQVAEDAVELSWQAAPTAGASLAGYRIYRSLSGEKASFVRLGGSPEASFRDTAFEFGKTYFYLVRSLAQYGADVVESSDSETLRVTPADRFPPRSPTGLVAIAVPGAMELSWNPNSERDLAGYNIYRRENAGDTFRRINAQAALTPTFRDTRGERGKRYTYAVTAVDASGNESGRSAEVSEDVQ